jgi:hypothetical protein
MTSNLQKFEEELNELIDKGKLFRLDLDVQSRIDKNPKIKLTEIESKVKNFFQHNYQSWYTASISVVKQIIPDRYEEFKSYYEIDKKRKATNLMTFKIQDWLNGIRVIPNWQQKKIFDDLGLIMASFNTQLSILKAAKIRLKSSLFDIKQLVQAELFDSELDSARELSKKGFLRPAGIVAGVVLERHLKQVCENHDVKSTKKNPTIADLNELLKSNGIVDILKWRQILILGDIRNYCGHDKEREPTKDEVQELIDETDKIVKTLF